MDNISVVQFGSPRQTSFEYLLPSLHGDLLLDEAQEVVIQVLIHKDALISDGFRWHPYVWTFAEPRSYVFVEVGGVDFENILQDEYILAGSGKLSVRVAFEWK